MDEDVAAVRERARIDEVIGGYLQLRNAGGGSKKGLCPFHDEKTPSFQVTPGKGLFYCFGCGEGGDVITFVQKVDNLTFAEAVQRLADRVGIQLRFTEGGGPSLAPGLRMRLLEAHQLAADYFAEQLASPDALTARQFLAERGFDRAAAEQFSLGYAPRGGRQLADHLRAKGFTHEELVTGGLVRDRGWDFFQGRLLWPIKDSATSVLGFGARRIFDDDRLPAKYVNTPETPLYKKPQVLYGLDMSRTAIGKRSQAVIVEGYTDVMACHLAGVDTAVASCGTAFGHEHGRLLRRLMGDHDAFHGEVIFTFDGDAAGQNAALKVFDDDASFVSQTYVAVEPTGLDPCDLRIQHGDAAVRELVGRRVPLYRFVMTNVVQRYDLDRVEGRVQALRAAAPLVASVRDQSMVSGYIRELAQMIGLDIDEVRAEVLRPRHSGGSNSGGPNSGGPSSGGQQPGPGRLGRDQTVAVRTHEEPPLEEEPSGPTLPDPGDRDLTVERETTKLVLQVPEAFDATFHGLTAEDFAHPAYRAVFAAAQSIRAAGESGADWADRVRAAVGADLHPFTVSLTVETLKTNRELDLRYATAIAAQLRLVRRTTQIADLKSRLQRTDPIADTAAYNQMFSVLLGLESERAQLKQLAVSLG